MGKRIWYMPHLTVESLADLNLKEIPPNVPEFSGIHRTEKREQGYWK